MERPSQFHRDIKPPGDETSRRTGRRAATILVLSMGAAFFLLRQIAEMPAKAPVPKPVPVTAAMVVAKPMPVEITTIGHVQPIESVAVRTRIEGQITRVAVADGQTVKAGDLLFQLDDRQARAALESAKAALVRDRAQLDYARAEAERQKRLAKANATAKTVVDQAIANAKALEGTVSGDEAQVDNAAAALSFTTITAPVDGRAGGVTSQEGNIVEPASTTPLITINQIAPIYVAFSVPQRDFPALRKAAADGPVAVLASPAGDADAPARGTLAYFENTIDPATGTLAVRGQFPNTDERLWPGQFVEVTVILRIEPHAITIPSTAVQNSQTGTFVFVIQPDSSVAMRPVTVARTVGTQSVIAAGLAAGETVVTSGQLRLVPGAKTALPGARGQKSGGKSAGTPAR